MAVHDILRVETNHIHVPFGATTVVGLLALYWLNVLLLDSFASVQASVGAVLILFVPGFLFLHVLNAEPERRGIFVASVVGTSIVIAAFAAISTAVIASFAGVERPISHLPLAVTYTGIVLGLLGLLVVRRGERPRVTFDFPRDIGPELALFTVPLVGVLTAAALRWYGWTGGSFVFIASVATSVVLVSRTRNPGRLYPVAAFAIALGLLLHRNLASPHIVGADIQALYASADAVQASGAWLPNMTGIGDSIPVMTLVPAAIALLLGSPLVLTFKVLFVFLFAFVPLGIYYFGEGVFDARIALFGALFFALYHLSFTLTPGKQLIAELFAILSLLALNVDGNRQVRPVLVGLFSAGIVLCHYGIAYVYGLSLLFAAVVLALLQRYIDGFESRLSIVYPIAFLGSATGWYAVTSPDLLDRIFAIPVGILGQLQVILSGGSVEQSGMTYLSSDTSLLQYANILLYAGLAALIGIGLLWIVVDAIRNRIHRPDVTAPEYVAIAVPFFSFLGASYFLVLNLWADRVFQLSLLVLAPLIPVGYKTLTSRVRGIVTDGTGEYPSVPLTALLVTLLLFSSGFVFAATGTSSMSTFNQNANDLSFDDADMQATEWLRTNGEISRTMEPLPGEDDLLYVDYPQRVHVYTDPTSYQLLRSTLSPNYYSTELIQLKNQWRPSISPASIDSGYILLREEAIAQTSGPEFASASKLSGEEATTLRSLGTVVYDRQGVTIIRVPPDEDG